MNELSERGGRLGDVTIVTIDSPSTGVLSESVRLSILRDVERAEKDAACAGIVLTGRPGMFAMGTALDTDPTATDAPLLADLCDRIEACEKPVVAAIDGPALGNGLELALAAHARVVTATARLGAPEITIGLVPGAGGTQRLPKVVGGVAALKMLLSGRAINGTSAAKLGLADHLANADVTAVAVDVAHQLATAETPLPKSSTRRDRLGEGAAFLEAVAEHRRVADDSPLDAPLRLIECIEAALLLPYPVGRGLEQSAFEDLVASDHSRALRNVFMVERRLAAASKSDGRVQSRPLSSVGLTGARGIGSEIAVACLNAGFSVTVAERSDEALEAGVTRIIEHYDAQVANGRMKEPEVEAVLDRLNAVCGFRTLADADLVVDPGPSISKSQVSELDAALKAGAVLATGTENVELSVLAKNTRRPSDVVGLRLYPGFQRNRMAEIIPGAQSSQRAVATVRAFTRKVDRLVVEAGSGSFGIGQGIVTALHAAADLCLEEGARIAQVDEALMDWGLPLGSFAWRDAEGLARVRGSRHEDDLGAQLAAAGRLGRSSGSGFYVYQQRGRPGVEDPGVLALVERARNKRGQRARQFDDGAIRKRCLAAMAGAGARLLADGTAQRPSDIDMVAVHGLGFARRTGGVMFAADLIGLEDVRELLLEMSQKSDRFPAPSPVIQDLIRARQGFAALDS